MSGFRGPARTAVIALLVSTMTSVAAPEHAQDRLVTSPSSLPGSAERAYAAVATRFDRAAAMDLVAFMQQYWRVAGNPGFNASIDYVRNRLVESGFDGTTAILRVDEFPNDTPGWDYDTGTVKVAATGEVLLSRERDRVSLAINSFSTPSDGLRARLVDVGAGASEHYDGKDVRGAVVLGDAALGSLWKQAVKARGAVGVISTAIAPYIRPADPAEFTREEQKDVLQWGRVEHDPALKAFGFTSSWRAAARLRELLRKGPVELHIEISSRFYPGPNRSLVAEIPGRTRPLERIVMVAHVQEPGANDNASGCATLYGLAAALVSAIRAGVLPQPERTLTFMWVDEIRGSREWLKSRPREARGVQYMFALDMTGEDTHRTGGTFLIEKQPDPSAVWDRPSDPQTEWGAGKVHPASLRGSLLNDLHLAVCSRRASDTGWTVRTNPYAGGSDHATFGAAGIPSLLNWHFTDRYYHTNQDTIDKVSADEMRHVGVAVAASAWLLAAADSADALAVTDMLEAAALRRLALERAQGSELVAHAADPRAAAARERAVLAAWHRWYREALDSVLRLPVAGPSAELRARIAAAKARIR